MARIIEKTNTSCVYSIPYLSLSEFDRSDRISLWGLARLFEAGRVLTFRKTSILSFDILRKEYISTMITGRYAISRVLSRKSAGLNFGVEFHLTHSVVDIGSSSVHIYSELKDSKTGTILAWLINKMVYIDPSVRKAKPLPHWLRGKYGAEVKANSLKAAKVIGAGVIPLKASDLVHPADMFQYKFTIAPSDTDSNGHTNNSSYLRFCMDAATTAVKKGALEGFYKDMVLYNAHHVVVFYAHETYSGDEVVVNLWRESGDSLQVCFILTRHGNRVFNCRITFYPLASAKY